MHDCNILFLLHRLFGIISRVSTDQETPKLVCRVIEAEISGAKVINPCMHTSITMKFILPVGQVATPKAGCLFSGRFISLIAHGYL